MPRKLFGLAVLLGWAAMPVWADTVDSTPAATLGVPRAAVLGIPRSVNAPSANTNTTLYRGANPDPLVGDYEPPPAGNHSAYLSDPRPSGGSSAQPVGNDDSGGVDWWDPKATSRVKSVLRNRTTPSKSEMKSPAGSTGSNGFSRTAASIRSCLR